MRALPTTLLLAFFLSCAVDKGTMNLNADADGDGIIDKMDACLDAGEDHDGFQDEDGCPDPDNDQDHVPDVDDLCPDDPEDLDRVADEDGCPETDADKDGRLDQDDACPLIAGTPRLNGCPVADKDGDCTPDHLDLCPERRGDLDKGGCVEPRLATLSHRRIDLHAQIFFEFDKATLRPQSFAVLDEVAALLRDHPALSLIEIRNHRDDQGDDFRGINITDRRARSVEQYLIHKGIDPERLQAKGFGETQPLAPLEIDGRPLRGKSLKEARAINRRTEFHILKVHGTPLDTQTQPQPLEGCPP